MYWSNFRNYQNSHEIVIGGDFNEDISKNNNSRRASKLKELIADCELQINFHGQASDVYAYVWMVQSILC
jgi:hypothetical protein